jgi:hypothetical protein
MEVSRMRYDERLAGWRGVERAMERERNTRANCDAGRFTRVIVLDMAMKYGSRFIHAGGRLLVKNFGSVWLIDAGTGALIASFNFNHESRRTILDMHVHAIVDRWIPFVVDRGRRDGVLLLDCVEARMVQMAPPGDYDRYTRLGFSRLFSIAGACVSVRDGSVVTVTRVSGRPNGATIMRKIARFSLARADDEFWLCERGRSSLVLDRQSATLQLLDLATGLCKRVFAPCTFTNCAYVKFALDYASHSYWTLHRPCLFLRGVRLCYRKYQRVRRPRCPRSAPH